MRRDDSSPEAYIADVEGEQRKLLLAVRGVIRERHPDIGEGIAYGMLDYPGLANLAAQKNYVVLYVAPEVLAKHKANFPGADCGKSCLRLKSLGQFDADALAALLDEVRAFRSS